MGQLSTVLKPLRDEFTALAADKGLKLTVRLCDEWVLSDAHWLRRIIQNFLSNAVRYTNDGGVLVGYRRRGNQLVIEVWDTGDGIPDSKLKDIFGEFHRLNHQHQDTKGLGLGLAIVDRMAKRMGHQINVKSRVGQGTCFSVTIPITQADPTRRDNHDRKVRAESSFENINTFCIDNDPEVLTGMNALLGSWHCNVYGCSNL